MKDYEIVLKRDKKLAEMEKAVNELSSINTDNLKRENLNLDLFHELSHYGRDKNGGTLCHQAK